MTAFKTNFASDTYNGWTNWETWNTVLWATNDEFNYRQWVQAANLHEDDIDDLANYLSLRMPNWHNEDMRPQDYAKVNWLEVAEACLRDND